jgi:UbiD family decarboxylase
MLREIVGVANSFVTDIASLLLMGRKAAPTAEDGISMTVAPRVDLDRFRLRRFVDQLVNLGEVETHLEPVALADISAIVEASPKATLFKNAGPERFEIVGGVGGSRRRYAAAFGLSDERAVAREFARRMQDPQKAIEIAQGEAPVQQVVLTGDAVDLTRLPFYVQHQYDGAPYISSAIDYSVDPVTGRRNIGCRRLMLRSRTTMRSNLTQVSDLRRMFLEAVERGEHLPVNFAIGSHPLDFVTASIRVSPIDEFDLVGTVRGEPLPMVRAVSNGLLVPADAEIVVEGYFDKGGYSEMEGPYGEFLGYYGPVHVDPVYHVTAITMRTDALHQTVLHGTRHLARTEHSHQSGIIIEARMMQVLAEAGITPVAVYAVASAGGMLHARVSLPRSAQGKAREAIAALFAVPFLKHVYVVDEDVDVFSDADIEWAMANRFRADHDLVVSQGQMAFPMDVTVGPDRLTTKAGFDLTGPLARTGVEAQVAAPLRIEPAARFQTVEQALQSRPMHFAELMAVLGSRDGREIVIALDTLREQGSVARGENGEWSLTK